MVYAGSLSISNEAGGLAGGTSSAKGHEITGLSWEKMEMGEYVNATVLLDVMLQN